MADSHWSNVRLLLHLDGSDGSTTFTDASDDARTVTAVNSAALSTSQQKFGSASLYLPGTSGHYASVSLPEMAGDFTIEGWIYAWSPGAGASRAIISCPQYEVYRQGSTSQLNLYRASGASVVINGAAGGVSNNSWLHVAWVRESGSMRLYLNGTLQGSAFSDSTTISASTWFLGEYAPSGGEPWYGWLDEWRVTVGTCRYTSDFTAPSAAFPEGAAGPEAKIALPGPLGEVAILAAHTFAQISLPGPLGDVEMLAALPSQAWVSLPGPLGDIAALAAVNGQAQIALPGPLGDVAVVAASRFASISLPSPLGNVAVLANVPNAVQISLPGPLGSPAMVVWHDFTGAIDSRQPTFYVMDLITPDGRVRVPISSWQATLQTDAACYVQCVVPAAAPWAASIALATEFAILRRAELPGGQVVEYEMARTPLEPSGIRYDRGGSAYTVTLSGYPDAFAADSDPPTVYDRQLVGVRSQNNTSGGTRVVCDIDWLLRPGHRAYVDDLAINVAYINYYAPGGDHYMDIGERI